MTQVRCDKWVAELHRMDFMSTEAQIMGATSCKRCPPKKKCRYVSKTMTQEEMDNKEGGGRLQA